MTNPILENDVFYCHSISDTDKKDIRFFKSRDEGKGLEEYLKKTAIKDEYDNEMRTYLVRAKNTDELVAYFSLKAGLISLSQGKIKKILITFPGVEIANFSMNDNYLEKHPEVKGSGIILFNSFMQPIIKNAAQIIGLKVIYIFALPYDKLINNYKKYGFNRLSKKNEKGLHSRIKPKYDKKCIFMYQILE